MTGVGTLLRLRLHVLGRSGRTVLRQPPQHDYQQPDRGYYCGRPAGSSPPVRYKGRRAVIEKTIGIVSRYPEYGREAGVGEEWIGTIEKEIAARVECVRAD